MSEGKAKQLPKLYVSVQTHERLKEMAEHDRRTLRATLERLVDDAWHLRQQEAEHVET